MYNEEVIKRVEGLFKDRLEPQGFELVALTYRYENGRNVLRGLVDRPAGGITIAECAGFNRELGLLLEEKDVIPEEYVLEIASPGLDRPLCTERDFARNKGKKIKVFLSEPINGRIEVDGTVGEVSPTGVLLLTGDGCLTVPFGTINKAKRII
jgi:ribosome maturation factor RimP